MTEPRGDQQHDGTRTYVLVWDVPTRVFHWAIVALVFVSWLSADQGYMTVHLCSGLALCALLLFRLVWGFVGSTTSRFSSFVRPIPHAIRYLKRMAGGDRLIYAGHNPAGGLMVIALIAILLAQVVTGLFATDSVRFSAPLAFWISEDLSVRLTNVHGMIFNVILFLVWCHVVAVGFYLLVKGDNLIRPMLTGRKHAGHVPEGLKLVFVHPVLALLVLACAIGFVGWIAF